MKTGLNSPTMIERFFAKVKRSIDGCWEWTANKNNKGCGMIGIGTGQGLMLASRASYEIAYGQIPAGRWVLHHCDNPGCVRPDHLFLGNNSENVLDMHRKGRGRYGLTPEKVYEILWRHASGENRRKLMTEYGVSLHVIKKIISRVTWTKCFQGHD